MKIRSIDPYPVSGEVTDTTSTLSQMIRGEVVALAERTEQLHIRMKQLQTHADRESCNQPTSWQGKQASNN
jgi:hypothetical protein